MGCGQETVEAVIQRGVKVAWVGWARVSGDGGDKKGGSQGVSLGWGLKDLLRNG